MIAQKQLIFWAAVFAAFIAFVFVFKAILLPFVLGLAIAYLLNPAVNGLRRLKIGRGPAALIILFSFVIVIAAFFAVVLPVVYNELAGLSQALPGYAEKLWALVEPFSTRVQSTLGIQGGDDLKAMIGDNAGAGIDVAKRFAIGVAAGGLALLDILSVAVITPVVAYFMMKEWNNIAAWLEDLMPKDNKKTIMDLLKQIDTKLSGFVRGQITVAVVLGIAYAIALSIAGLNYGVLIGLGAGLLSIIPMVGSTVGLLVSVAVAWFQTGEWTFVAIIAAIFIIGQLIEGNFLTPKLVGDSVGLHPLWVFFALLAGGSLFGIVGMLLAVPVAAVVGVLMAFGIRQYKGSSYFKSAKTAKSKPEKNAD